MSNAPGSPPTSARDSNATQLGPPELGLSVVIVTLGRRLDSLERTLASVAAQSYPDLEILVVLNGAEDAAVAALAARHGARLFLEPRRGQCFGRNCGLREARGGIVAFTDDDVIVAPGWAEEIVKGFTDPRVWCVTGAVALDGPGYIPDEWCNSERMRSAWTLDRTGEDWFLKGLLIDTGFGCNMAYRREAFPRFGLFPTDLGTGTVISGGDEYYMFLQVLKHGGVLAHRPAALVRLAFCEPPEEQRRRLKEMHAGAVAFFLKLLHRERGHRWDLLRRLFRAVGKLARTPPSALPERGVRLSRWEKLLAFSGGVRVYLRSERNRRALGEGP
ncbi:MAG: glycosyltransferase family 2 protein [Acidobacteriota bacterium]|nr:glycosyltransferase family 2 protein [Acidobacteriota bacterium]